MSIEKIKHFISKDAMNIDGLGKKVVENFWDLKLIRYPYDIFDLKYENIEKLGAGASYQYQILSTQ